MALSSVLRALNAGNSTSLSSVYEEHFSDALRTSVALTASEGVVELEVVGGGVEEAAAAAEEEEQEAEED